jgi:hypothetical protein
MIFFEFKNRVTWFAFGCLLVVVIFLSLGYKTGGLACIGLLSAVFMLQALFKTMVDCFTMVSICHSMRNSIDSSVTEWDDLLED